MNRFLALLATALAPLCFGACSPYDPIAHLSPQPASSYGEKPAPSANVSDREVWPLGVAP